MYLRYLGPLHEYKHPTNSEATEFIRWPKNSTQVDMEGKKAGPVSDDLAARLLTHPKHRFVAEDATQKELDALVANAPEGVILDPGGPVSPEVREAQLSLPTLTPAVVADKDVNTDTPARANRGKN